jgi:apolipoprotein N-acyltransferase
VVISLPARLLLAGVSGLLAALSFEPFALAYLLPLAVAGLTLAVAGASPRRGFLVGTAFGLAFMGLLLPWLQVIHPVAWPALAALEALFYGVGGLATTLVLRLPWWPVWAATVWVAVESLRGSIPFGGFPWGRLGFAVVDTPVLPSVGYVGVAGTTFLVALVGTTLAWVVRRGWRSPVRAGAALGACALLACAASAVPTGPGPTEDIATPVQVATVQGDVPGVGLDAFSERRAVLDNHVRATLDLADRIDAGSSARPDLVVWPENSSDIDPFRDPTVGADVADAARAVGAPLLMGAAVGDRAEDGWFNRAVLWGRDGEPGASYDKLHPVPFGEYVPLRALLAPYISALDQIPTDMIPGDRPGVIDVGRIRAGVVMCFEVAYDGLVRDLVDGGANVVVVPTNNATYTGTGQIEQQFAISRVRAVETGRTVVVASTNGISGVIDADGSVLQRAPERRTVVLEQAVDLHSSLTVASRLGGALELVLAGAALVSTLAAVLLGYRRRSPRNDVAERKHEPV